jgi:predicted TIM-barrel fold metal-dependent hydrolase
MIIDVNVSFGHWPFQRFPYSTPEELNKDLMKEGISQILVSSLDAVLYPDPEWGNETFLPGLKSYPSFVPVGVINPSLSNWKETLKRCISWGAKAIKIFPNYHYYSLSSPVVDDLMDELVGRKMPLIVQMRLEDERNQYPLLKVSGVEIQEILDLANRFSEIPILALCPYFKEAIDLVKNSTNIYVDISFVEILNTVSALLEEIPATRVLFGSHTPFLYTRSAIMKLKAAEISQEDLEAITCGNAQRLMKLEKGTCK